MADPTSSNQFIQTVCCCSKSMTNDHQPTNCGHLKFQLLGPPDYLKNVVLPTFLGLVYVWNNLFVMVYFVYCEKSRVIF